MRGGSFFTAAVLAASVAALAQQRDPDLPVDLGLTERTGISLVFLDVAVHDDEGRPMRGLGIEDFEVTLNRFHRELYSVDDLCGCGAPPPGSAESSEALAVEARYEPARYVLYFDLAQLLPGGRERAIREARRWLGEIRRPADEVMIAAFATDRGLSTISTFTTDGEALDQAMLAIETDPLLADSNALELSARRDECEARREAAENPIHTEVPPRLETDRCGLYFQDEYTHGRRSFRALLALLTRLAEMPGRKSMLFFFEELIVAPGAEYGGGRSFGIPHSYLLDEVASAATASRTTIHSAFTGTVRATFPTGEGSSVAPDYRRRAINFGANLSDWTGGRYNFGPGDLPALLDRAGRDCECIYRIGIEAKPKDTGRIYQALVVVRGQPLEHPYRVEFPRDSDRWRRKAEAALLDPLAARGLAVNATIVPLGHRKHRWDVMVEVALDPDSLMLVPDPAGLKGNWEVGALLAGSDAGKAWEMLSVSKLRRDTPPSETASAVIHRHRFEGLKARSYELRAFARDRWTGEFGGSLTTLLLPAPEEISIVGPVALAPADGYVVVELPLWGAEREIQTASTGALGGAMVAVPEGGVHAGQPLEFRSWLCGNVDATTGPVRRRLFQGDKTVFDVGAGQVGKEDDCLVLEDRLVATELMAGGYRYEVTWNPPSATQPIVKSVDFKVLAPVP